MIDFLLYNWAELLVAIMTFTKVVCNLLPSEKPIKIWEYLDLLVNAIVSDRVKGSEQKD